MVHTAATPFKVYKKRCTSLYCYNGIENCYEDSWLRPADQITSYKEIVQFT